MLTPDTPSAAPTPSALVTLVEHPLEDLSADAAAYLPTRPASVGVAVVVPSRGALYVANGDELFPMASIAKVAIMAAVMDRAIQEERDLTAHEIELLDPMITVSDNEAATQLWAELGGAEEVGRYLRTIGLATIEPDPNGHWGASHASAKEVALLFAKLAWGGVLDTPRREIALNLLSRGASDQRWGTPAGLSDEHETGTVIAMKDGWYPDVSGWWVNTAGLILPGDERPGYAMAVLAQNQPSFEDGVETTEGIAARIHVALHSG